MRRSLADIPECFLVLLNSYSPLTAIEHGSGYIIIRSPYTPYSIYLKGDYILAISTVQRIRIIKVIILSYESYRYSFH